MQNCREVAYLVASDGLELAAWHTRLLTRLHLLYCKRCRRYATELATIGRISREAWSTDSVDSNTVQHLEGSIMDYASGGHDEGQKDASGDGGEPIHWLRATQAAKFYTAR